MSDDRQSSVGPHEMTLVRVIDAPQAAVWKAWTDPEDFSYWFGGSKMSVPLETISLDVKPGGQWKATMVPEQGDPMEFSGTYPDVQQPDKLVMTFNDMQNPTSGRFETLTVTLQAHGDKTEVTLHQSGNQPSGEYLKLVDGYNSFMDAMNELFTQY